MIFTFPTVLEIGLVIEIIFLCVVVEKDTIDGLCYPFIETEKKQCEPFTWTMTNKDTEEKTLSTKEISKQIIFFTVDKAVRGNS